MPNDHTFQVAAPETPPPSTTHPNKNHRSVVHKNLEDNYGAVISANHEALAQILEQVSNVTSLPPPQMVLPDVIVQRLIYHPCTVAGNGMSTMPRISCQLSAKPREHT